jgi:L,D-transpeptidase ErfK/SrfK
VRQEYAAEGRELPAVVPPGPENPLGEYALRLGLPGYLIHGTNRPAGVGMRVTHGCIRLFPEDIEWLFPRTEVGMAVRIVNQPVKFGWRGDALYLEVHPPLTGPDGEATADFTEVTRAYVRATGERQADIDWDRVTEVYRDRTGMPVQVGRAVNAGEGDITARLLAD